MISQTERSQIRQLLSSPQWQTLEHIANDLMAKIREDTPIRDTEWDTIKALLAQEGKVQGIKELIQELYKLAQHD